MSWTTEDKRMLLAILQEYGASDLGLIQQKMPHKSISEIRYICHKHTNLALNKWLHEKDKKYDKNNSVRNWLDILKKFSNKTGPVHDIIPRVLKYIALYEKRTNTTHINLRDCYLVLSDISNGTASKKLDDSSQYFLFQCLIKLAEALRSEGIESYKHYLRSLESFADLFKDDVKAKCKNSKGVLNPLRVPGDLLKMTEVDKNIDVFEDIPSKLKVDLNDGFLQFK
ncbi:uncharacterized protein LOC108914739 [Anoplophora glabripennis]|uniref:uncharacterized protein LOC108914739 n=1 Tax=Anoplophora glabripennis TaxID=217634 RepID=UPI0008750021|nr:uncharacterized protein LOC108914739 [Anoplophora glabripennis]